MQVFSNDDKLNILENELSRLIEFNDITDVARDDIILKYVYYDGDSEEFILNFVYLFSLGLISTYKTVLELQDFVVDNDIIYN